MTNSDFIKFLQDPPRLLGTLLWLHGDETEAQLWQAFRNAVDSGIGELVLESRPHWDYLGPKWWSDLSLVLDWCGKENIKAYLFDEKWYPSGVAGHTIQKLDPDYVRMAVRYQSIRYTGPQSDVSIMLPWTEAPSRIMGAYAYPTEDGRTNWEGYVDLSDRLTVDVSAHMHGILNALRWDVPQGEWLIVFLIADRCDDYIDPLNPYAVQAYIDRLFESTKHNLGSYFGKPLAGIFFDEPGYFSEVEKMPYSPYFAEAFAEARGYDPAPYLALLWLEEEAHPFKYDFFETLNSYYAQTFCRPLQDWCHKNGLELIGHWYEHEACPDQGERFMFHQGFGEGPGDFFKVSRYADQGGMDLVGNQVIPGCQNRDYWGLPKLASSAAHMYNLKDDLTLTETFGAYGWHVGLRMMKWLTDWHAVRGVNHYILHAFNPRFPDLDCPPYYYDGGHNPQWQYFNIYVNYVNRLSALLRGGRHVAPLLVLYPGAMGYAGRTHAIEDTQRFLQEIQYDYDLISADILAESVFVRDSAITVHKEQYQGIMVSGQEVITAEVLNKLCEFAGAGAAVMFLYQPPSLVIGPEGNAKLEKLLGMDNVSVLKSHTGMEAYLAANGISPTLAFSGTGRRGLRVLHRILDGQPFWLLSNENIAETVAGSISVTGLCEGRSLTAFEPLTGECWTVNYPCEITIPPYRALLMFAFDNAYPQGQAPAAYRRLAGRGKTIVPPGTILMHWATGAISGLPSWLTLDSAYSGTVDYTWQWDYDGSGGEVILDLGEVCETAELAVNGVCAGISIVPPYRFDIGPLLRKGTNTFKVSVTNTVSNKMSVHPELEDICPSWKALRREMAIRTEGGLLGPVAIYR